MRKPKQRQLELRVYSIVGVRPTLLGELCTGNYALHNVAIAYGSDVGKQLPKNIFSSAERNGIHKVVVDVLSIWWTERRLVERIKITPIDGDVVCPCLK